MCYKASVVRSSRLHAAAYADMAFHSHVALAILRAASVVPFFEVTASANRPKSTLFSAFSIVANPCAPCAVFSTKAQEGLAESPNFCTERYWPIINEKTICSKVLLYLPHSMMAMHSLAKTYDLAD